MNVGVIGPNVFIWATAEVVVTNVVNGYVIGYVNTDGSTASGPFYAGGAFYAQMVQYEPNVLVMFPQSESQNWHTCWIPPIGQAPHPVWH